LLGGWRERRPDYALHLLGNYPGKHSFGPQGQLTERTVLSLGLRAVHLLDPKGPVLTPILGVPQHAHRDCIQKWINEKGNKTCEICGQPFVGEFEDPPPRPPSMPPAAVPLLVQGLRGIFEEAEARVADARARGEEGHVGRVSTRESSPLGCGCMGKKGLVSTPPRSSEWRFRIWRGGRCAAEACCVRVCGGLRSYVPGAPFLSSGWFMSSSWDTAGL
jgi:RING-variant domain